MMSLLGIAGIEYSDVVSDLKNYPDKIGVTFTYKQYSNETNQMNLNDNLGLPYTNQSSMEIQISISSSFQ